MFLFIFLSKNIKILWLLEKKIVFDWFERIKNYYVIIKRKMFANAKCETHDINIIKITERAKQ